LYYQRDLGAFLRLGVRLLMLALVIGAAVLVLALLYGRWILGVLYTADYARFETEFHIIVLAHCLALLTNVLGAAATQMRIFWIQVPIQLVTLAVTVVAAVLLIPGAHPVLGAAHTALIRAGTQFALYAGCAVLGVVVRERILKRQRANSHP
jgi:O-antigen/teichoic acid export membrane protein